MHYIAVIVGTQAYHGTAPLTYAADTSLPPGTIVVVPLRHEQALGVVVGSNKKPGFPTKAILEVPPLPALPSHLLSLLQWMSGYYPSSLGVIAQHFLPKKLASSALTDQASDPKFSEIPLPQLTNDQQQALKQIGTEGTHLLHGTTGSGKTRVYIELAKRALKAGKSAIVLTPEISLTSQLASNFRKVFGEAVIIIHSQLTETTRRAIWFKLLQQPGPFIIIGPRSALFMPLQHLGLIVIDEAHEPAYKQDQAPYYHAARVASKLAELARAPIVLGTATPLISDYYLAEQKKRPIIRMQQIAVTPSDKGARHIQVVDLRDHSQFTKKSHLSDVLVKAISQTLAKQEQVLLFLNRRGTARIVFCEQCGWQATCPHCDLPLVYHGDSHRMRCHACDYNAPSPTSCPQCQSTAIIYKTVGTKAIAEEVMRLFPEANVQRFDTDNTKAERIEQHYDAVHSGSVDIIVGTQTLAKGLDLPKLGLVGVVLADTTLYIPDFSAQERTFQLLSQVIGRIGRGHRDSQAIVQTYNPNSPVLKAAMEQDWSSFYHTELAERQNFLFPPFCYLLKLTCRRATSISAQRTAQRFMRELATKHLHISIEGPAPAFHEKSRGGFAWQLVIKSKDRANLLEVLSLLPSGWNYDIDPLTLM